MKLQRKSFAFDMKAADGESGTFEGYGNVFGVLDSYDEIMAPGAFADTLAATAAAGRTIPVLWQHDMRSPIGVYTSVTEDHVGLKVAGQLAVPQVQQANEALALMKMRAVTDMSIGYYTRDSSYDEKTGVRTLKKVDLVEVSLVTLGACPTAQISAVKARIDAGDFLTVREFQELLREQGFSSSAAAVIAERGYKSYAARESADTAAAEILKVLNQYGVK